jgi:hypothetical protein
MADKSQNDHWASLASELGAAPPPDETPEPAPETREPAAASEPAAEAEGVSSHLSQLTELAREPQPDELPKGVLIEEYPEEEPQPATDWDLLAEELGIAPSDRPAAPPPPVQPATAFEPEPPPAQVETTGVEDRVEEGIDVFDLGEDDEADEVDEAAIAVAESQPTAAATVSGEEATQETERKGRRRRRRRRKPRGEPSAEPGAVVAESAEPAADAADEPPVAAESQADTTAAPPRAGDDDRRRSRRDRGRDRDRPRRDRRDADAPPPPPAKPSPGGFGAGLLDDAPPPVASDAEADYDELDETPEEDDAEPADRGEMRPAHKAIPTWQEAIGAIVKGNMERRSRGGRGRGQGGHERRGPQNSDRRNS